MPFLPGSQRRVVSHLSCLIFIATAAVAVGLATLGKRPLDIFDTSWIQGDLAQVYIAWRLFLADPNAGWLHSSMLGSPYGVNFALFDPMPILLLLAKWFLSDWFPDGTQYFGWYFVICLFLQGSAGYFIVQEILRGDARGEGFKRMAGCLGALFFIVSPFTLRRFSYHTALSSQWLLGWSIWMSMRSRVAGRVGWLACNGAVLLLACGISPYLALMVALLSAVFLVTEHGLIGWREAAIRLVAYGAMGIVGLLGFGFAGAASVEGAGYGYFSMNALGPFSSDGLGRLNRIAITDATGGQSLEGFDYLGAGVLLGLAWVATLMFGNRTKAPSSKAIKALAIVVVVSYLLALSFSVSFGPHVIRLEVPGPILSALSRLRASGRLFWIGAFCITTIVIAVALRRHRGHAGAYVLAGLLAVQIYDVSGVMEAVRGEISRYHRFVFDPTFEGVKAEDFRALVVLPPWQCGPGQTPGGPVGFEYFGSYAAAHRIPTNSFYAGRNTAAILSEHCKDPAAELQPNIDNIYVLTFESYKLHHDEFAGYSCMIWRRTGKDVICVRPDAAPHALAISLADLYLQVGIDERVTFGINASGVAMLGDGWSAPESWGTWSDGNQADLKLVKSGEPISSIALTFVDFPAEGGASRGMSVTVNDLEATVTVNNDNKQKTLLLHVPEMLRTERILNILIRFDRPTSPKELGLSDDGRRLAMGLQSLVIKR